jgi:hypothetical protein
MPSARPRSAPTRSLLLAVTVLAVAGTVAGRGRADPLADGGQRWLRATEAGTLNVRDAGRLHLVSADGSVLIEEGRASGTLPGTARVTLNIESTTIGYSFTFHVSGGSLAGRGTAALHSGNGRYESFGGAASIRGGTGRYAHISGKGGFYGVLNRSTSNAEVQVIGKLHL